MKIINESQIEEKEVDMEGAKDATIKILIGTDDGSENMIMRRFKVQPNGYTPRHTHDIEHLIKIENGKGLAVDENGEEHEVSAGNSIFIEPNTLHQMKNPYSEPLEFLCVIPNQER